MKLLLIAYGEALEEEVKDILNQQGVQGYTQWKKVYGKGNASGPHLGTHVWPKANNVLAIAVEDTTASELMDKIRELKNNRSRDGIKAFTIPVEEFT